MKPEPQPPAAPMPEFYHLEWRGRLLICERTTEDELEFAQSVALLVEALNWSGPVVFVECPCCPWRRMCRHGREWAAPGT